MAHTTTHIPASAPTLAPLTRFFSNLFTALVRMAENNPRMRQIAALAALSDEELAAKGLKRENIARYVLKSDYWV